MKSRCLLLFRDTDDRDDWLVVGRFASPETALAAAREDAWGGWHGFYVIAQPVKVFDSARGVVLGEDEVEEVEL